MHPCARLSPAFVLFGVLSAGACGTRADSKSGSTHDERVPIAQAYLDRAAPENAGLLAEGPDGLPVLEGDGTDPAVVEARLFYDTVQIPNSAPQPADQSTGESDVPPATAPLTRRLEARVWFRRAAPGGVARRLA